MAIGRTNCGAAGAGGRFPAFAYTGDYALTHEGEWLELLSGGTLTLEKGMNADVFLAAAGQGGGHGASSNGRGGYGGETKTVSGVYLEAGKEYAVTIGAGGGSGLNKGGDTGFADKTVTGGQQNYTESTAFGLEGESLYGADGGTGFQNGGDPEPNTGNGGMGGFGNGAATYNGQKGSSGIVIVRKHREG